MGFPKAFLFGGRRVNASNSGQQRHSHEPTETWRCKRSKLISEPWQTLRKIDESRSPKRMRALIKYAIAENPVDRFQTVDEFAEPITSPN